MQSLLVRFDTILHRCVFQQPDYGYVQAMLFSDCAFLAFKNSLQATLIAASLMRGSILAGVPVRMGLGRGTFYSIELSTSTNVGKMPVSKSRFMGTAVIRAHSAERCEGKGKGMRIFLDASLDAVLPDVHRRIKTVPFPAQLNNVNRERDFLYEPGPIAKERKIEAGDRALFRRVAGMMNPEWPEDVRLQYTETLEAMNRMRHVNNRKLVNLRKLKCGVPASSLWW